MTNADSPATIRDLRYQRLPRKNGGHSNELNRPVRTPQTGFHRRWEWILYRIAHFCNLVARPLLSQEPIFT